MLIVSGSLTIQDMYARKRGLISAIDGATFSISNSTIKMNEAGVDAALIYMNDNRVQNHEVDTNEWPYNFR
jgi:hypothetical protein